MGEQEKEAPCLLNGCTGDASIIEQGSMNAEELHTIAVDDIISYT